MDDPWGSPWAAATDDKVPRPPSPIKSTLEPPPRAFLTSSNTGIPTFSTSSPWDDDDGGFGGINSADNPPGTNNGTNNGTNGWSGWASGDVTGTNQQLTPIPRDDGFGRASPIAWPGTVATSPGNKVLSRSNSVSTGRQPSPDPWASEFPFKRGSVASSIRRDPSPMRLDELPVDPTLQLPLVSPPKQPFVEEVNHVPIESRSPLTPLSTEKHPEATTPDDTQENTPEWDEGEGKADREPVRSRSRRSSSMSDESRPDDRQHDSPITSIDEDSRIRSQTPQRKASSKVQVLVDMYDGMGKKLLAPEGAVIRQAPDTEDGQSDEQEADPDFGEFEEAEESAQAEESRVSSPESASKSDRVSTPTARHRDSQAVDQKTESPKPAGGPADVQAPSSAVESVLAKFGPIRFPIDLSKVDELFSDAVPASDSTADKVASDSYVPDHVLIDSFTEISERKTWYRISRQGPMRKHDSGADEENYRRVVWTSSAVREQTIGTVRRWMEEDSFGGRPVLGGGGGGGRGNIFGWDSKAAPVALDEVFGKKRRSLNSKKHSISQSRQPRQPSLYMPGLPTAVSGSTLSSAPITESPVAQFGWSSLDPNANASSSPLQKSGGQVAQAALTGAHNSIPAVRSTAVKGATPTTVPVGITEDEDDWGEMVFSPEKGSGPGLANGFFATDLAPLNPTPKGPGREAEIVQSTAPGRQSQGPTILVNTEASAIPKLDSKNDHRGSIPPSLSDPWASADFSFFDSKEVPAAPPPAQSNAVEAPKLLNPTLTEKRDQPPYATAVTSSSQISPSPPAPTHAARQGGNVKQDALVARVIGNLPDLSYMLR